jgi:2-keto-3-deoxy-L-rhamnonate aldolase RhmA
MGNLKARLHNHETVIGTVMGIMYPDVSEILALAGFDYLWIDLEHGPGDFAAAQMMIQGVGGRCPCIIRVPENRDVWIKKALDTGADGIVIPLVNTADEARRAVAACKYPPEGTRGAGVARAHEYGMALSIWRRPTKRLRSSHRSNTLTPSPTWTKSSPCPALIASSSAHSICQAAWGC